ncbi:MAG: hypothetical protein QW813_00035 [Candidatus Aenigmatarchaeota archaeon]
MALYKVKTFIGIFTIDDNKKVISFSPFPKDPILVASRLKDEVDEAPEEIENFLKENLLRYALEYKFVKNQAEFNQFLTEVNSEIAKQKIKEIVSRDVLIIHTNNAIEELDKSINIFIERLREWYSLHFPEMDKVIEDHKTFAKLIEKFGNRKDIDDKRLNQFKEKSMGIDFTQEDIETVKALATTIIKLYELRERFSNYLSKLLKEIAPNFSVIAGDVVAAKLIAKAGGLERLARMPSSTIQLLGAEKALFRFLKSKKKFKSPKFGLIYNHPLIKSAPKDKQGKIARLLSSKLSIAARIDYYSKEYKADKMKKELEEKVKEVLVAKK